MFYNMTVLFLLMCQIPARTRCIFVFRDFECIGGGVNDTVAAVGGTAQGIDVKALFFFHLPYHVRRCTEKVFLGVAVGKDGDVGHFLVFYRYLHFYIPAEGIGGTRADAVFQVVETSRNACFSSVVSVDSDAVFSCTVFSSPAASFNAF